MSTSTTTERHEIRILGRTGHETVAWTLADTTEAKAAVAEAERIFAQHRAQGCLTYAVASKGAAPVQITEFDQVAKQAYEVLIVAPMQGGC